jgi:hypothetical protein
MLPRLAAVLLIAGWLVVFSPRLARAADRLILRNLDFITNRTVTSFDEDGLVLDGARPGGGERVTWDEVERGRVAIDQPRFDRLLAELGTPLYRIRQRLRIGDYTAAGEPAEPLYAVFAARRSQSAYLVCQAVMWSRLAKGQREAAVEPYLRCLELLRTKQAAADGLPGARRLQFNPATGIADELMPIWFDGAAAGAALASVQQTIRGLTQPRPEGAYVYYASLSAAAGQPSEAERVLPSIKREDPHLSAWRDIIQAEQELTAQSPAAAVERLHLRRDVLPDPARPVALLICGTVDAQSADEAMRQEGLLMLLTLPAVYGTAHPELAAAGLYQAALVLDKLKESRGAAALRRELTAHYGQTHHGRLVAAGRANAAKRSK